MSDTSGPRYKIDREIGRGAFGVVYLARDNVLRRDVALKVMSLPEGLGGDERGRLVERFYREARAAAGLSHPNTVIIHDISKAGDKHFISMEYLEGWTLTEEIEGGPLGLARALYISGEILAGLEYAHAHEVVHRDIKPDNIFLLEPDGVKIVDFGLARVQASTTITKTGAVMGSPGYIAPEVIDGKTADKRTDVFSFGVVFYEMLTGVRPFGPRDAFESFVRVVYRIMSEAPEPPSALNADVPREIDALVERMLAKDPGGRFEDAGALRRALDGVTRDMGPAAEPPAGPRRPPAATRDTGDAGEGPAGKAARLGGSDAARTRILEFEEDLQREATAGGRKRSLLKAAVAACAGLVAVAAITVLLLFVFGVFRSSNVKVPNLVNLEKADAVKTIKKAGLEVGKVEDFFSYEIWKGKVAGQKPSAGTEVPRDSSVDITVSMGRNVAQVPDVVGLPEAEAVAAVTAFQFKARVTRGYSETVPVGCVISERPAPGTLRAYEDVIVLVVNSGVRKQATTPRKPANR